MHDPPASLQQLARRKTAVLTTYRRDGSPVATAVTVVVEGDRVFIRTYDKAWKVRRMRNNPSVAIAPATFRAKPAGPAVGAKSRLLAGDEARHAARAVSRRQPLLQGVLVPAFHRIMGYKTLHYELTPVGSQP